MLLLRSVATLQFSTVPMLTGDGVLGACRLMDVPVKSLTFMRAVNRQGHPSVAPIAGTPSGILTMYPKESSCRLCLSRVSVSGPKPLLDTKSPTKVGDVLFRNTIVHRADPCLAGDQIAHTKPGSFCRCIALSLQSVEELRVLVLFVDFVLSIFCACCCQP